MSYAMKALKAASKAIIPGAVLRKRFVHGW
ncbi:hypothetical protein PARA125_000742 [Parachlamydia sp. AcF125]|nr:hypothetical protein [Parachlamydia sp. AcF125]